MKTKNSRGLKTGVTSCTYTHKGDLILAGCEDFSVQMWDSRALSYHRPSVHIEKAHIDDITCIKCLRDPNLFVTRSMKGKSQPDLSDLEASLKLWDIRKTKDPIFAWKEGSLVNTFA